MDDTIRQEWTDLLRGLDRHVPRLWTPVAGHDDRPLLALVALHAYHTCVCDIHEARALQAVKQLEHSIRWVMTQEHHTTNDPASWQAIRAILTALGFTLIARCGAITEQAAAPVRAKARDALGNALLLEQLAQWSATHP